MNLAINLNLFVITRISMKLESLYHVYNYIL